MADGKVLLEVVVEGKNVKVVQREVEGVTDAVNENTTAQRRNKKAVNETAGAHEHYDRGLKGVHQTNLSGAKSFSKIRDVVGGSSGLVGAYATLAANLFAATAAFTALQKAAQVEQLTQGLSALGTASGLAMGTLAKGLQESTGYAISLQDAMRQVAMVTSAGFDTSVIERLGAVATNTSIALGRDVQDSMNRLVKGATKLEPELLDELGIMVRLDEATQQYAKQMGKSASELTNFEKRQAFMNAVLAEGEKKFGAIGDNVDPNPYDKLSATIQELSATILNFANILLGPLAGALASSKMALLGVVLVISKGVINQALPYFSMLAQAASKAAQQYSASWSAASREAMANVSKARAEIAASDTKGLTKKQAVTFSALSTGTATRDEGAALQKSVEDRITKLEARKQAGWKSEKDATKVLSQQMVARYERELSLLTTKLGLIQSINVAETANIAAQAGSAVSKEASDFAKTIEEASNAFDDAGGLEALTAFGEGLKKVTLGGVQYVRGMTAASGSTTRFTGILRIGRMGLTSFGATATAVGRVVSFAFKGLLAAIPYIGMIMLAVDLLTAGWNKLVDAFKSDATKELEKKLEKASSAFEELGTNSEEIAKSLAGTSNTITTFSQRVEAQSNIVSQLSNTFKELDAAQRLAGDGGEELLSSIDAQIQKNPLLLRAFEKEFNGLKSVAELREKNKGSYEDTASQISSFIQKQNSLYSSQNALNKTVKESNDAFTEYANTFVKNDAITKYGAALQQIQLASSSASDDTGGLSRALTQLSEEQLKFLGLTTEEVSALDKRAEKLDQMTQYQTRAKKALDDFNSAKITSGSVADVEKYSIKLRGIAEELNKLAKSQGLDTIELTGNIDKDKVQIMKALSTYAGDGADNLGFFGRIVKKLNTDLDVTKTKVSEAAKAQLPFVEKQIELGNAIELNTKKISLLQEKYKVFGIMSGGQITELIGMQEKAARDQLGYLDAEIKLTEKMIDTQTGAQGEKLDSVKIDQLNQTKALLEAEKTIRTEIVNEQFSAAGKQRSALEFQLQGLESVTNELNTQIQIQQKLSAYAKETSEARMKIREADAKLENLRAGGTGELSAQKQYDLQVQANRDRKAIIEQEKNAKIQALALEKDLTQKRFEISLIELSLLKSRKGYNELPQGLKDLVDRQLNNYLTYETVVTEANGVCLREEKIIFKKSANIGEQVYAAGVEAANITARAEVVADEVAEGESRRRVEIEARNSRSNFLNEQLAAENTINDIYNRINSARTSILDNERRVRENELKAINLRNTGKYELTAQQTLELEMQYAVRKEALIIEEYNRKVKLIDLEYQLLEAQTAAQQFTLKETMAQLETNLRDSSKAATAAGNPAEAKQFEDRANYIRVQAERLDKSFTALIKTVIPEAKKAAGDVLRAETDSAISDLGAGVLSALQSSLNSFNPVITATIETAFPEIGQMFDGNAIAKNAAEAANSIVQNTIINAKSKLEELGNGATGPRVDSLNEILSLEKQINEKRAELNKMKPEDRQKALEDTGAGSLNDLLRQQQQVAASDPFTKMKAGAAALNVAMAPMVASLKSLGPQGELVAAIAQGSVIMADSFTTLADSTKTAADKFAAVGSIIASVAAISSAAGNAKVANIDKEINAEKKRDGKSKDSLARIASLEKKKESIERKNFERNKKLQMAQTVISAASAIAGTLAMQPAGPWNIPIAFAIGGLALSQLAIIAGTSYEGGGSASGSSAPGSISVGERRSTVDLAKSQSASGELSYMQGDRGTGGPENFRPAFIGSRAAGGRVNAGYMVGEQGPELFVPKVPGRIVPSDKINSAPAQNVNISISALDASGVEEVLVKQRGHIIGMIREAANSHGEKFLETVDTRVYTQPSTGYSGVARA